MPSEREQVKREKTVSILDKVFWSVQPPPGLLSGEYYRGEMRFGRNFEANPGHLGVLEVVRKDGRIIFVEFNEVCSPMYYMRMQQNMSKRLSDYGFLQASKERTAHTGVVLVNGLAHLERQMMEENRLTGDFDLLTGASNSINKAMLPLAKQVAEMMEKPSGQVYYGLAKQVEPGLTGYLQVVAEGGKLIRCHYDEIFADRPEEIADEALRPYYRQSKCHAPAYISTLGMGFNIFSDFIEKSVLAGQCLTDLSGVPVMDPPKPSPERDYYLALAKEVEAAMKADGVLPA